MFRVSHADVPSLCIFITHIQSDLSLPNLAASSEICIGTNDLVEKQWSCWIQSVPNDKYINTSLHHFFIFKMIAYKHSQNVVWSNSSWTTLTTNNSAYSSERQCQRIWELTSHASKVMLKILQARLQQYVNWGFPDLQAGFRKGRGGQIANSQWIIEKARESQKNIYFCFIDYPKASDCVDHNKLWKILKEIGIPDRLTCLLRNLYAGQEATGKTGHGTTNWF